MLLGILVVDCFTYPMPPGIGKSQRTFISELSSWLSTGTSHVWWLDTCGGLFALRNMLSQFPHVKQHLVLAVLKEFDLRNVQVELTHLLVPCAFPLTSV
jgi:hypothetical protein